MVDIIVPGTLEPFVEILGVDLTLKLILKFGGAGVYIPNSATRSKGALAELIGSELAIKLGQRMGSGELKIPLSKVWMSRHLYYEKNLSIGQIARTVRISEPSARKYIRGIQDDRQTELPI